jgi:hypothetical protein
MMNVSLPCSGGAALSLEMVVVWCFSTRDHDTVSKFGGKTVIIGRVCDLPSFALPWTLEQHNLSSKSRLASSPAAA